ncbi:L-carnitine dehydratase/bile acid-inducible protein F [Hyaloraphidium curvatum]|nr:L-carnitine dehydratase/bile acid-inducible protein F [Hyaloraphidium curvatum]
MSLPFAGLKVIDCATYIAGPSASTILADFGADVVKVENPEGDPFRTILADGQTWMFELEGRSRRSLVLDLKSPEGSEAFRRLTKQADILVCNVPFPSRKRLGIDAESMLALNPRLIYASVSAWGEIGPEKDKPGFDATAYWARSGLQDFVKPDYEGAPATSVGGMGDHPTALALYASIATGLYLRERTGKGGVVATSLLANGLWSNSSLIQGKLEDGDIRNPKPRHEANSPLFNNYRCACNRWINLSILNEKLIAPACRILGCPEVLEDPRFSTKEGRRDHAPEMIAILDQSFAKHDRAELAKKFDAEGITYGLISTLDDVVADEQIRAAGMIRPFAEGKGMTVGTPVEIGGVTKKAPTRAPGLGQHTDEILAELGFSAEEVARMKASGAAGVPANGAAKL